MVVCAEVNFSPLYCSIGFANRYPIAVKNCRGSLAFQYNLQCFWSSKFINSSRTVNIREIICLFNFDTLSFKKNFFIAMKAFVGCGWGWEGGRGDFIISFTGPKAQLSCWCLGANFEARAPSWGFVSHPSQVSRALLRAKLLVNLTFQVTMISPKGLSLVPWH